MILNLTQHTTSPEQREAGVQDCPSREDLLDLLTFESPPSRDDVEFRSRQIASMADQVLPKEGDRAAMIGGAPFLMGSLERALVLRGIQPLYAFSRRESVEEISNGVTRKVSVFRHLGFVEANTQLDPVRIQAFRLLSDRWQGSLEELCQEFPPACQGALKASFSQDFAAVEVGQVARGRFTDSGLLAVVVDTTRCDGPERIGWCEVSGTPFCECPHIKVTLPERWFYRSYWNPWDQTKPSSKKH